MAYERSENRRGWREPRSRFSEDHDRRDFGRDDEGRDERGFFERAGDEVASWFGDDDADRRRREDFRGRERDEDSGRRPRALLSDEDFSRYDRQPRFRDEGYRRPYTGRSFGRSGFGEEGRGTPERQRDFTGMAASGLHDPHYSEWRRRQIDALDRDYDEYRRENQDRFENEFSSWRTVRQGKRQMLGQVREHMTVVGSDEQEVGKVDCVQGDRIILTKQDSEDSRHHEVSCARVDRVDGDKVILDQTAEEAKRHFQMQGSDRGFFRDDEDRERGPHMLNRSFSGTYER